MLIAAEPFLGLWMSSREEIEPAALHSELLQELCVIVRRFRVRAVLRRRAEMGDRIAAADGRSASSQVVGCGRFQNLVGRGGPVKPIPPGGPLFLVERPLNQYTTRPLFRTLSPRASPSCVKLDPLHISFRKVLSRW